MNTLSPSRLYVLLIIAAGLIGGYVFYGQWIKSGEALVSPAPISNQDNLATFQNLKIDFSVLDDSAYKKLVTSGEAPVNPGTTGKKDLFAP
jgi:hypothetical protein